MTHGGGGLTLWGYYDAGGTGALHKTDGIMGKEQDMEILKQRLRNVSARKLKLRPRWIFQMDQDPTHMAEGQQRPCLAVAITKP